MLYLYTIDLAAGETRELPFNLVVCPQDVAQKQIENTVRAYYTLDTSVMRLSAESNTVRTPVEETPEIDGRVRITKNLDNFSLDPKGYVLNEKIDYDISVYNGHNI